MLQDNRVPGDVTAQEPEWRASELLQALPVAVYTTDASGTITAYNEAAADLWGVRPEIGSDRWCGSWRLLWPDGSPMDHGECPLAVALREDREIRAAEAIAERPDGSRIPFLAFPTPLHDAAGALRGAVNTLVDITEQKLGQQAAGRLSSIIASSHDAIISKDLNGIITTWNEGAERLFGYSAEEVTGKPITILIPDDRQEEEPQILERIRSGEKVDHFETLRVRKDGSLLPISLTISPVRTEDGRIVGVSKIARDITEQKESEQRIRALLREVNHRVKNQFAVILAMIRETNRRAKSPEHFEGQVRERVMALSRSHDLLVQGDWRGATVFELLLAQVKAFGHEERITMSGPSLTLQPMAVQYLGIALHELATNSAKYGVLSGHGTIRVEWRVDDAEGEKRFRLTWNESDGPRVGGISENGFGQTVLKRIAPAAISGTGVLEFGPNSLVWTLDAPLKHVEAKGSHGEDVDRATAVAEALASPLMPPWKAAPGS